METTKHDIEAIVQWLKRIEKEEREKHIQKLEICDDNSSKETIWSSFHFGQAEGILLCISRLNIICGSSND